MLSFTSKTDKDRAIALGYDNKECVGKPIFTVYFIPDYNAEPEIQTSDPASLIVNERFRLQQEFALSRREFDDLLGLVARHEPVPVDASRGLKRAYLAISKTLNEKLKKELEFGPHDNVFIKPIYDTTKLRTNHICTLFGSSGAGKSYQVNDMLMRNPCVQNEICPAIYLFSSVGAEDPSYAPIRKTYQMRFFYKDPKDLDPEDLRIESYEDRSILVFDDINSIANIQVRKRVIAFRETCLEIARHKSLGIISTEHLMHNRAATQRLRNSSAYMVLYPRNGTKTLDDVAENLLNLNRYERGSLIKKCKREARAQILHIDYPNYLCNTKRVQLF